MSQKKLNKKISAWKLCDGYPIEFSSYLNSCRNLKYKEKHNYDYKKDLLKESMKK